MSLPSPTLVMSNNRFIEPWSYIKSLDHKNIIIAIVLQTTTNLQFSQQVAMKGMHTRPVVHSPMGLSGLL